jgi:hypothetical protein
MFRLATYTQVTDNGFNLRFGNAATKGPQLIEYDTIWRAWIIGRCIDLKEIRETD